MRKMLFLPSLLKKKVKKISRITKIEVKMISSLKKPDQVNHELEENPIHGHRTPSPDNNSNTLSDTRYVRFSDELRNTGSEKWYL